MTSLDGINGRSIQTLLRGENDSKHLDEIRATDKAPRSSSKLTPLSVVFSTLFSVFYLVMKHCFSCLIYLRKAFIICPTLERLSQAPPPAVYCKWIAEKNTPEIKDNQVQMNFNNFINLKSFPSCRYDAVERLPGALLSFWYTFA